MRERLLSEIERLGTTVEKVSGVLARMSPEPEVSKIQLKTQLVDLGMSLTDLPDSDFDLIDKDKSGLISVEEFSDFLQVGVENMAFPVPVPPQPQDDLLYQPIDLAGRLYVRVAGGKHLRQTSNWFSKLGECQLKINF